jgi:hypothetical protein
MTKRTEATMNIHRNLLCAVLVVAGLACKDTETANAPPKAVVEVLLDGEVVNTAMPIPYDGDPVELVLSGSKSEDTDGTIAKYEWLRTDVPAAVRNGTADGGVPFDGDPDARERATVVLDQGSYRFTLFVTDDGGAIGTPASVAFSIEIPSLFDPDAACVAAYEGPNDDCEQCVCSAAEMNGCLDLWDNCMNNADAMFSSLCKAVYDCGIANACLGTACYAPDKCSTQIDAAAAYMGGTLASCSDAATPPEGNPCRAVSTLSGCINAPEIAGLPRMTCSALCAAM